MATHGLQLAKYCNAWVNRTTSCSVAQYPNPTGDPKGDPTEGEGESDDNEGGGGGDKESVRKCPGWVANVAMVYKNNVYTHTRTRTHQHPQKE